MIVAVPINCGAHSSGLVKRGEEPILNGPAGGDYVKRNCFPSSKTASSATVTGGERRTAMLRGARAILNEFRHLDR